MSAESMLSEIFHRAIYFAGAVIGILAGYLIYKGTGLPEESPEIVIGFVLMGAGMLTSIYLIRHFTGWT